MYAARIVAGIGVSSVLKLLAQEDGATPDIQLIGLMSILIAGGLVLLVFWIHYLKVGSPLLKEISLKPAKMPLGKGCASSSLFSF